MAKIIRHIYVYCQYFNYSVDYTIFFSQISSPEGVLPNAEFFKKIILPLRKNANLMVKPL